METADVERPRRILADLPHRRRPPRAVLSRNESPAEPARPLSIVTRSVAVFLLCVAVAGCRPFVGGEAGEEFKGTLEVNDRGCLLLHSGDITFPFVLPGSEGLAPANGMVDLPDGRQVRVGDSITTNGVSWRLSSRPEGASIAQRCGYDLSEEVAQPQE